MKKIVYLLWIFLLISCSSCGLINTIKNDIALHNFEKSLPSLEVESTIIEDYELSEVFNINGEDIELTIEDDLYCIGNKYKFEPNFKPYTYVGKYILHENYIYMNVEETRYGKKKFWLFKFDLNWELVKSIKINSSYFLVSTHDGLYNCNTFDGSTAYLSKIDCETLLISGEKIYIDDSQTGTSVKGFEKDFACSYYFEDTSYVIIGDLVYKYQNNQFIKCSGNSIVHISYLDKNHYEFYSVMYIKKANKNYAYQIMLVTESDEQVLLEIDGEKDLGKHGGVDYVFKVKDKIVFFCPRLDFYIAYCMTTNKLYQIDTVFEGNPIKISKDTFIIDEYNFNKENSRTEIVTIK